MIFCYGLMSYVILFGHHITQTFNVFIVACIKYIIWIQTLNWLLYISRLIEYESCEKLFRDIEGILNIRDLEHKSSEKYVLCSSQARIRLKQFGDELHELSRKLQESSRSRLMYALL